MFAPTPAALGDMAAFHEREYLEFLQEADSSTQVRVREAREAAQGSPRGAALGNAARDVATGDTGQP